MAQREWSQSETARRSGVPQNHISQYVRGETKPGIEALDALAGALGVSIAALLGDEIPEAAPAPVDPVERLRLEAISSMLSADEARLNAVRSVFSVGPSQLDEFLHGIELLAQAALQEEKLGTGAKPGSVKGKSKLR